MVGVIVLAESMERKEVPLLPEPGNPSHPTVVGDDEQILSEAGLLDGVVNSTPTPLLMALEDEDGSAPAPSMS